MDHLIPTEKLLDRLRADNPWWGTAGVPEIYKELKTRLFFNSFYTHVTNTGLRRAVVLLGPRRVGKTVMMYHAISALLRQGVKGSDIMFVGVDNPIFFNHTLDDFLELFKLAENRNDLAGSYIFFDEIQYLKDWERHLKVLVDTYPHIKFIVSGSATAALRLQSTESGAGRFTDFLLPPLTFQEYLYLKNVDGLITAAENGDGYGTTHNINELNTHYLNYLNYGGYPEVVMNTIIRGDMGRYVKNDIIDKVLMRDLPSLYGIKDVTELNRFFAYIAYNTGNELSYENISIQSGIAKDTVKKYLEYLESAFLVQTVHKIDVNAKTLKLVTRLKVYLTNPSLRTALFSEIREGDSELGAMVETGIVAQQLHLKNYMYYARWKNNADAEVDFVTLDERTFKPATAAEVKWTDRFFDKPGELKGLLEFCGVNKLKEATVTARTRQGAAVINNVELNFLPAAIYTYYAGFLTTK